MKLRDELRGVREDPDTVGRIYDMDGIDSSLARDVIEFAMMMKMNDREFEKYLDAQRTLREWLLSRRTGKGKS